MGAISASNLKNHKYCTKTFDLTEETGDSADTAVHCYESKIGEYCTYKGLSGAIYCASGFECFDDSDCETGKTCSTSHVCVTPS